MRFPSPLLGGLFYVPTMARQKLKPVKLTDVDLEKRQRAAEALCRSLERQCGQETDLLAVLDLKEQVDELKRAAQHPSGRTYWVVEEAAA